VSPRARVLVVDDEPDFLELAEDVLAGHDLAIRTAADPEIALARLEEEPADVMLVDLQMPKGGGRRLLRDARTRFPEAYAIVVTAYGSERIAVELLKELGAFDYLSKTEFEEKRVVAAIDRALRAKRADGVTRRRGFETLIEREDGVLTVAAVGHLTAQPRLKRLALLAEAVDAAREAGERRVLVDLGHLAAATPLAFGHLLCAAGRLRRAGGVLAVYGAGRAVAPVLELFDRALHGERGLAVFADRPAALEAVRER